MIDAPRPETAKPRDPPRVTLAHGGGGRLMRDLVEEVFADAFGSSSDHDGSVETIATGGAATRRIATTTDGYVVRPLFFPGGSIGTLAVHGTVNDLAACGARPVALSAAFILEEGIPVATVRRVAESMAAAARASDVPITTGDTKVVERGKGDGIYVTTSGLGVCDHDLIIHPRSIRAGDAVILDGDVGRHGMAVMAARAELEFDPPIESDSRSVWPSVRALLEGGIAVHCLRDLTRGGLATGTLELAAAARLGIELDEERITVEPAVAAACEMLGLDPLYVANDGRFAAVVPAEEAERAVTLLRLVPGSERAAVIGRVSEERPGRATLVTRLGTLRNLPMLSGEQLPRIC